MIQESDRKRMLYWVGNESAKHQTALFVVGILIAICGLAHVGLAAYIAHLLEDSLFNVFQHLATSVDLGKTYSGSYVMSANELSSGLLCLILSVCFFVIISVRRREREQTHRLMQVLKKRGAWQ